LEKREDLLIVGCPVAFVANGKLWQRKLREEVVAKSTIDPVKLAVVFKCVQDNKREMLFEQRCDQRCGNGCRISLSTSFWYCQDVSEDGDTMRRDESVCSTSGDNPFSFIGAKVQTLCEENRILY
jgi:hypothetical protein